VILSLDASTTRGSIALVNDGQIVKEIFFDFPRGRGGALFSALRDILSRPAEPKSVIVGVGPGSYNGIRAAIAVAWGIATAREIPLVGISSLLGLGEGSYCAVGDARRGQYYFARVCDGELQGEPELLSKDQLVAAVRPIPEYPVFSPVGIEFLPKAVIQTPSAARLARLASGLKPGGLPQPIYLKAPHITTPVGAPQIS
jgi:tRNA threonylcarbamoyladenosine biosynthesis protein TsaB